MYRGFTLIETLIVILISGIIASAIMPRFMDYQFFAQQSAVQGLSSALSTSSAGNYAVRKTNAILGKAVNNCTDNAALLPTGLSSGYTITALATPASTPTVCTITSTAAGQTATFIALGIS